MRYAGDVRVKQGDIKDAPARYDEALKYTLANFGFPIATGGGQQQRVKKGVGGSAATNTIFGACLSAP